MYRKSLSPDLISLLILIQLFLSLGKNLDRIVLNQNAYPKKLENQTSTSTIKCFLSSYLTKHFKVITLLVAITSSNKNKHNNQTKTNDIMIFYIRK